MPFTKVAAVGDLTAGKAKQVIINGRTLGLYNVNGTYYAIDDTCTHRGAPLSEGDCEGTVVTCPWHGAQCDVRSGGRGQVTTARHIKLSAVTGTSYATTLHINVLKRSECKE